MAGTLDLDTMRRRLALVESRVLGGQRQGQDGVVAESPGVVMQLDGLGVSRAAQLLGGKLDQVAAKCPDLVACDRYLQELTPLLMGKNGSVVGLAASLNEIMTKRESIIKATENLAELKVLSVHIDVSVDGIAMGRLLALENDIEDMKRALELQTQEIIEILDYYDTAMSVLSGISLKWDSI